MNLTNTINQDIINMVIDALQKRGVKPALDLADKLLKNDEDNKKIVENILKE